jgi:hypothetical protein
MGRGKKHLGCFADEEEAARAYDAQARELKGDAARLNFPAVGEMQGKKRSKARPAAEIAAAREAAAAVGRWSQYRGVSWDSRGGKWLVQIWHGGKQHHLGYFADEEEAARAYDAQARELKGDAARLNFPAAGEMQDEKRSKYRTAAQIVAAHEAAAATGGRSRYRGLSWDSRGGKWEVKIRHGGKQHNLGYFADEEEAARAYDAQARELKGGAAQLNFPAAGERQGKKRSKARPAAEIAAAREAAAATGGRSQ